MTSALTSIRNVAFVGHPSSGKTTLVDALAFQLGVSARKGSVADKSSICDTEPEEQEKGHTLQLAIVQAKVKDLRWTLIDTPGYPDFSADANSAIYAADLVVGVHSASGKVSYNLRKKLELAQRLGKGCAIVITHVDGENVDFESAADEIARAIGPQCVPCLVPNASGAGFAAVASVLADAASPWRKNLMDRVMDACADDDLLARYLETETLSDAELHAQIPVAIAKGSLVPVLACNPDRGAGVDQVLGFLGEFGPHPGLFEQRDVAGEAIALDPEGPLAAVVVNVRSDPHVGKVCTLRVLRGTLAAQDAVGGPRSNDRGEKLGGLFVQVGKKKREATDAARPGELVAITKVDHAHYGDVLTTAGAKAPAVPVVEQPTPMVSMAVVPKSRSDEQKIGEALKKLEAEDPTFKTLHDPDTHELVIRGMSDLHLQVIESRLKRRFGVEVTTHVPRIAYRETVTRKADGHHRHKKQTGGRGQFGECYVRIKPMPKGSGVTFTDAIVGGSIPRNLIPAVEKGMREVVAKGVLTNSQVVDLDFEVYDGKFHDVDSDEASFKIAGARAFVDAFNKAAPVLLEPVMELVISVPTEHAGAIFSDLTSHRRGQVIDQSSESDGAVTVITAHAPLSAVMTYQRDLKSQTAGEGSFSMKLHDYAAVPAQEQQRILAQIGKRHEAEE
jgi:elongation factor G